MAAIRTLTASSISLCSTMPDPNPAYYPGLLVDCRGLGLNHVPHGIPSDTTTLTLSRNNLTLLPGDAFTHLHELRELDLSRNQISRLLPYAFRGLGKLIRLDVGRNELPLSPQTYPVDLFKPLVSLNTLLLNLNSRSVSSSPDLAVKSRVVDTLQKGVLPSVLATPLHFVSEQRGRKSRVLGGRIPGLRGPLAADGPRSEPKASSTVMRSDQLEGAVGSSRDVELGYPDEALSHLPALQHLALDGLTNRTLGPGFRTLSQLTHLDMNGKTGYCKMFTFHIHTLAAVQHLTHLNMSDCDVKILTSDAFSSLQNLTSLDLSFNQALGFDLLGKAFRGLSHTKLTNLTIDAIVPFRTLGVIIDSQQLRYFRNLTHLERLQTRLNRIEAFEPGALCSGMPPNLKHVVANGNLFELAPYVNDLVCLESLAELDMSGLDAYWTPPLRPPDDDNNRHRNVCQREEVPAKRVTRRHSPSNSEDVCQGERFSVPPRLEVFRARDFGLQYNLEKVRIHASNSLRKVDLSENHFPRWQGPLCGFYYVEELLLMDTLAEDIDHRFFPGFPALRVLNISTNRLRDVFQRDEEGQVLSGMMNLAVLDLSWNNLGHLPNATLSRLESLKELYLHNNGMGSFVLQLSHMKKLQRLDVSMNQLHALPGHIRDHLDRVARTYNVTVDMTFNPIACICDNIDFLTWLRHTRVDFATGQGHYYCLQGDGSVVSVDNIIDVIERLERTCVSYVGVLIGASASCVIVVTLLVGALAYRFRWKLRYLYFASRLGLQRDKRHQEQDQQKFSYDAFVSFATEDQDFVMGELKSRLEDQQGLTLCIHTRDFTPGQYIASNIVDSVQRSRRTLVVVSRALLASDWCHYELQMALMDSLHTGRDVLLFLLYQHVPAHELSRDMLANLQATSYMEFPEEEDDGHVFWTRLARALKA
ncbi:hypothetical protein V1264_003754 [Littorina saxatilis]